MTLHEVRLALAAHGKLRASINLGNPVLAHGSPQDPGGVTVGIARLLTERLGVDVELVCFDAARESFAALVEGRADIGFLAIEPARAAQVHFTDPYVVIEGVYAVPTDSQIGSPKEVDTPGVRIGVKEGSAYDLFLTRTLQHASIVRGRDGVDAFLDGGLEVAAGIREPMTDFVAQRDGVRLVDEAFMQIRQAVAIARSHSPQTSQWLDEWVAQLISQGVIQDLLRA